MRTLVRQIVDVFATYKVEPEPEDHEQYGTEGYYPLEIVVDPMTLLFAPANELGGVHGLSTSQVPAT